MVKSTLELGSELAERLSKKYGDPAAIAVVTSALVELVNNIVDTLINFKAPPKAKR